MRENLSYEYIRGLIEGEGSFTFSTRAKKLPDGTEIKERIPAFSIGMHERDEQLLCKVRDTLGLTNRVYNYKPSNKDGYNRGRKAFLIIREFGSLKNVVIPFFYNNLVGNKAIQFNEWLEKIGRDPSVAKNFKLLYRLHKNGYYAKNPKYSDELVKREKSKTQKSTET
ncbi:LAGLIDADG family homing endonuclease [Patescibacteria group bacterium]|nr:LAGLIDADG family homing endonuclease [Patescibacteria group bacterium]